MTVYGIATIRIEDRTEFKLYQRGFMEIFRKFDGELLAVDEAPSLKEGEWPYTRTVIASFPDRDAMDRWYHSDEYRALTQHRFRASSGNFVVVQGFDP
jgi:uncharacterized protein (DUF1330 family)